MSLNLQLFRLLLITNLRYGLLGFTLSMFLDILIIIFLCSSLHNRRFMNQARRTRYFERSAKRGRSARRGEERNKPPVASPFFWLFRPPMPTSIDYRRWCLKGPTKTRSVTKNSHLSGYQKHRQQHKTTGITTTRAKITFNNIRLGAAKLIK